MRNLGSGGMWVELINAADEAEDEGEWEWYGLPETVEDPEAVRPRKGADTGPGV